MKRLFKHLAKTSLPQNCKILKKSLKKKKKNSLERFLGKTLSLLSFPVAQMVKNLPVMQETWVRSLGWEIPWKRKWQPTPVFSPGKFHGQRSLAGYS